MSSKSQRALLERRRQNLDRIARGVNDANALLKQFTDHPAAAYQLLLRSAGQIAFEAALARKRSKLKLPDHTIIELSKLIVGARRPPPRSCRRPSRHSVLASADKEADPEKFKQTANASVYPQPPR